MVGEIYCCFIFEVASTKNLNPLLLLQQQKFVQSVFLHYKLQPIKARHFHDSQGYFCDIVFLHYFWFLSSALVLLIQT